MSESPNKPKFKEGDRLSASVLAQIRSIIPRLITGALGDISVTKIGDRIAVSYCGGKGNKPETTYLRQFVVQEEKDDHLVCSNYCQDQDNVMDYDEDLGEALRKDQWGTPISIWVAKPYLLQKSPWEGKTLNGDEVVSTGIGTRTLGGLAQEITPAYAKGEIIVARQGATGIIFPMEVPDPAAPGVGAITTDPEGPPGPDGSPPMRTLDPLEGNMTESPVQPTTTVNVPVMWQDVNEAGRTWGSPSAPLDDASWNVRGAVNLENQVMGRKTKAFNMIAFRAYTLLAPYPDPIDYNDPRQYYNRTDASNLPISFDPITGDPTPPPSRMVWVDNFVDGSFGTVMAFSCYTQGTPFFQYDYSVVVDWIIGKQGPKLSLKGADALYSCRGNDGKTGSFTTVDGKTITVTGGIITSIV